MDDLIRQILHKIRHHKIEYATTYRHGTNDYKVHRQLQYIRRNRGKNMLRFLVKNQFAVNTFVTSISSYNLLLCFKMPRITEFFSSIIEPQGLLIQTYNINRIISTHIYLKGLKNHENSPLNKALDLKPKFINHNNN